MNRKPRKTRTATLPRKARVTRLAFAVLTPTAAITLVGFFGGSAQAATAPANDAFTSATGANPASVLVSGSSTVATTAGATYDPNERAAYHAAPSSSAPAFECWGGASVWYAIPSSTTHLSIDVSSATNDTAVTLWAASNTTPDVSSLSGRNAIRVGDADTSARIDQDLDRSEHYFLAVDACNVPNHSRPLGASNTGSVTFVPTLVGAPANDDFAQHALIGGATGSAGGDTRGSRPTSLESCPVEGATRVNKGVWFRWTAPTAGSFLFATHGSSYNTLLCAGPAASSIASWSPTVSNDDVSLDDQTSAIKVVAAAGSQWDVLLEGADDGAHPSSGPFALSWAQVADTTAPTVAIDSPAPGGTVPANQASIPVTVEAADAESGVDHVTVSLQGSPTQTITSGPSGLWSAVLPMAGRSPGAYTLSVTATDGAGNTSPAVSQSVIVVAAQTGGNGGGAAPLPAGYTGAGSVSLTGTKGITKSGFATVTGSHGKALSSSKKNATVTLHFVGTGVDLHFDATKAGGKALITLDGKKYVIDLYNHHAHDFLKALKHLKPGTHVVSITVLGQKQAASSGYRVVLSLLRVYA